jgi:hypothetical protein
MKNQKSIEQEFLDILSVLHRVAHATGTETSEPRTSWRAAEVVEEAPEFVTWILPDFPDVRLTRPLGNLFLRVECVASLRGELLRVYLGVVADRRTETVVLRRGFVFVSDTSIQLYDGETRYIAECAIPARSERLGNLPRNTYPLEVKYLCLEPVDLKWADAERFLQAWQEADFKPSDAEIVQWLEAKIQDPALRRAKKTREAWEQALRQIRPR